MARYRHIILLPLALGAGCGGGGGGGESVASTPPPPAAPAPNSAPTTAAAVSLSVPLSQAQQLATTGVSWSEKTDPSGAKRIQASRDAGVSFRYSAASNSYEVEVPGSNRGRLVPHGATITQHDFDVTNGLASTELQRLRLYLINHDRSGGTIQQTYTGWADLHAVDSQDKHRLASVFAFGIPTTPGDVPIGGTATYTALVRGAAVFDGTGTNPSYTVGIGGKSFLSFDFAKGELAGYMEPTDLGDWGPTSLGRYTFVDTQFGVGSRTFSGRLSSTTATGSSFFEGQFTGPRAAELMANWQAPVQDPWSSMMGTMSGVFIGKQD